MDPVTHAALGAAVAQAALGRYNKKIPWKVGALSAMAPDLDVFIRFSSEPLSLELWHRSFTHSLLFIPVGGLIVALLLCCIPYFRKHWQITFLAALLGYATHGLLDACTAYGTQLFWPWHTRISWDIVAIIDPFVTIPLVLGTAWSVIHQEQKAVTGALVFVACFFLFNIMQHQKALQAIQTYAQEHQWNIHSIRAIPALTSSTQWQIIAKQDHCLLLAKAYTPIWKNSSINDLLFTQQYSPNMLTFPLSKSQQRSLELFQWFTDDYVMVAKRSPLTLADGRYVLGYKPLYSLWGIQLLPGQERAKELDMVPIDVGVTNCN